MCDITGCKAVVPSHLLLCPRHWKMVPADLRRLVYRTWAIRKRDPFDHRARAEHEDAKRLAIEAVKRLVGEERDDG